MACNKNLRTMLLLLLAAVAWQQLVAASKVAYKKPLYGKLSYVKEKRFKLRSTSSPTISTEPDWPAPVEFIINSTPRTTTAAQEPEISSSSSSSSTTSSSIGSSSTPSIPIEKEQEQEQEADGSTSTSSSTPSSSSSTPASLDNTLPSPPTPAAAGGDREREQEREREQSNQPVPCTCGVFLTSQIKNGLSETPLIHNEMDRTYPCNAIGRKQCQTKCLEAIVQHLPNSANIVCGTLGHDCHKERAYLFIKNCQNQWVNTNLQAGREYCCKAGVPYRCPLLG